MFGFKGGKAAGKTGPPAAFGVPGLVLPAARPAMAAAHARPVIAPGRVAMPQAAALVIPGKGAGKSVAAESWHSGGSMNLGSQATTSKGKGKGKISLKIAMGEPAFVGKLRRFDAEKGSGFIACAEVYAMCHAEVYAFKPILESQGIGVGDTIVFFVHWNAKGKPQATYELLRIATAVPGEYAMKGIYKASTDPSRGFGFIEAPLAHEFFQRDIYVSKEQAAILQLGQTVAFNVKLNKDLQPSAADLVPVDPAWEPTKGDLSMTQEDTTLPAPWECSLVTAPKKASVKATGTGELFLGTIKAFNEKNGWGFVTSEALAARFTQDIFVHHKELVNLPSKAAGTMIQFELAVTEDGKPQAINAQPIGGVPLASVTEPALKKQRLEEVLGLA